MSKTSSYLHFISRSHPSGRANRSPESFWAPNADVYTTEEGLVIKVELAGLQRDDLELALEGNRLKISGQRDDQCRRSKCNFLVMEINYGSFESVIELPDGCDASRARAAYHNGFLRIDVPFTEAPTPASHGGERALIRATVKKD